MLRARLDQDITPVSEFRANSAALLDKVRSTKRPLVLTQRGHSAAVLLDVAEYERLIGELELLRDVRLGEEQLQRGEALSQAEARRTVLERLRG